MPKLQDNFEAFLNGDAAFAQFLRHGLADGFSFWRVDTPTQQWLSPEFTQLLGLDPGHSAQQALTWQDFLLPQDRELAEDALAQYIDHDNEQLEIVARFRHSSGKVLWIKSRGTALRDETQKITHICMAHSDLTSFVDAAEAKERAWRRTYQRLNAVLNTAHSGIIGLDNARNIVVLNPPAREILGDIPDQPPFRWPDNATFLDRDDQQPLAPDRTPIARLLRGDKISGETHLMASKSNEGGLRYVRLTSAQVKEPDTGLEAVIVIDDITEREKNRQTLERSARLDALGQLTGGIAHDFNNLMTTVLYAISLAQKEPLTPRTESLLDTAKASVYRGRDLTKRLLAFGKRQPGLAKSQSTQSVLDDLKVLVTPVIEAQIELDFGQAENCTVFCDPSQLENALLNLVLNSRDAILHSGTGQAISVTTTVLDPAECKEIHDTLTQEHRNNPDFPETPPEHFVAFSVTDDGPGMSQTVRARATDPFFTTKSAQSGTGLGLSMVYGFVRHANGVFQLESTEGTGTTARLILPRGNDVLAPRPDSFDAAAFAGDGRTILLAEDEAPTRAVLSETLQGLGYQVLACANGDEAWDKASSGAGFDILLTDMVMPGKVSGMELGRRVRENYPHKPVIFMSGYTDLNPVDTDGVAELVLHKPFDPEELARALYRHQSVAED